MTPIPQGTAGSDASTGTSLSFSSPTRARAVGAFFVLAGLVHLLLPEPLLSSARVGYDIVLDVGFSPSERSIRRVRLVGLGMVAVGAHLLYHGGVHPRGFR